MLHRAKEQLTAASPAYRWMFAACEKARARAADWPAHIFVPQDKVLVELPATLQELGGQQALDGSAIPAEKRRRELRWMPPIAVNVDDIGALPAVVRRVK